MTSINVSLNFQHRQFRADNVLVGSSTKVSPKTSIAIEEVSSDHNIIRSPMFGIFVTGLGKATKTFGPGS